MEILEGLYYRDVNLSYLNMFKSATERRRQVSGPPPEIKQPFLKNMVLDILIKRRNPFVVDNNIAQLDIHTDLSISGKLNNPIIKGQATIESGTVSYKKTDFKVTRGVIDFVNPYRTEPSIIIDSNAMVRQWEIDLEISGTPDELEFKLSSTPAETEGDILSILLFGKTTQELIGGEGGGSQTTSQMLAEMISSTFAEDIKKATGVDILEVETGEQAGEQDGGQEDDASSDRIKVTVGKKLSKHMTVKYAVESKDGEMIQQAISEYQFLENLILSGFRDTDGVFGGKLFYRLEFR